MNEQYTRAPHQSTSSGSGPSPNAALLIDFDNVTMAMRSNLGQELRNFLNSDIVRGKVSVQRAYADWRRYPQYIVPLSEASIDLIFAPAYGSSKKNATDIRLAIDALEIVFTRPEIGTYILLSGDSDFSSLVLKLKEYGKYVIGVGLQESSSDLLVQNCDEYYSYNSLSGLTSADEMSTQSHDPWELVERAVHRMADRDDVMRSDRLKQVMLEMDAGFDEKDHGFSKFNRFLAEASSRSLVKLRKIGDGQYEVKPARELEDDGGDRGEARGGGSSGGRQKAARDDGPSGRGDSGRKRDRGDGRGGSGRKRSGSPKRAKPSEPSKSRTSSKSSASVDTSTLRAGYDLLRDVVADLAGEDEPVRDSEVKREMLRREESFDEAALGFSKFSRFLRQAHDEEVVDVAKDDDGNYHLAPAGSGIAEAGARSGREARTEEAPGREQATGAPARDEAPGEASDGRESAEPSREPAGASGQASGEAPAGDREAPAGEREGPDRAEEDGEPDEKEGRDSPSGRSGSGRRRGRGLGRGRRGSRRGSAGRADEEGSDGEESAAPGPVDRGGSGAETSGDDGSGADEASAAEDGGTDAGDGGRGRSRRRGGLGRFRKGSRGGAADRGPTGSGATGGGDEEADDAGAGEDRTRGESPSRDAGAGDAGDEAVGAAEASVGDDGAPVPEDAADDPVGHMVGRWPGVGRKTAEKLVEAFGDEVFRVIDDSPDRLTEVLPDHRAQAVVEARREERERVGA